MHNKIFLEKLFVTHIFTLLVAHFAPKLINYSRHSVSLKYVWKSTNRCYGRKMSSISALFRMFKVSLCREWLTNLDAKGTKRSVKMWTANFYKILFKIICRTFLWSQLYCVKNLEHFTLCIRKRHRLAKVNGFGHDLPTRLSRLLRPSSVSER